MPRKISISPPWCWFVGFRYLPAGAGWPACFAATQPNPPADVQTRLQAVGPPQLLRNRTSAAVIRQPSMWGILSKEIIMIFQRHILCKILWLWGGGGGGGVCWENFVKKKKRKFLFFFFKIFFF